MESILFTLDVFFMLLLAWSVFKADRDVGRAGDLGFFAFRDTDAQPDTAKSEKPPHA